MQLSEKLNQALDERQAKHGDEVKIRFRDKCLTALDPSLTNVIFFLGDHARYIKPRLADGTVNPYWPEGEEPPRDEAQRKEFYAKIASKIYEDWIKRTMAGEFDRPPVISAGADKVEVKDDDSTYEDVTNLIDDDEETHDEVVEREEREAVDQVVDQQVKEIPDRVEEAKEAKANTKRKAKFGSELANHQYPAGSHGSTLTGMLRCFVREVMVEEIDKLQGGITEQFDIDIAEKLENAVLKLGKVVKEMQDQIKDLDTKREKMKQFIMKHNAEIEALKAPKKEGGMDEL